MGAPELFTVPVDGGDLTVAAWGDGPPVLALHGITANHLMWQKVAEQLGGDVRLIAPDLRGRGKSAALHGKAGMAAHVRDAIATLDHLGIDRAMVVGGSMGGYVTVLLAANHPERVTSVGLCDGGVALPVPDGIDPEDMIRATVGPTIARLDMTFDSLDAYLDFWKAHPALAADWNDDIERYAGYDAVVQADGTVRSGTAKDAIIFDGTDLLTNADVHQCVAGITCPIWLLRAPRNLLDQPVPLISDEMLAQWRGDNLPQLEEQMVPDVNHFTLFLTDRGASVIAERIRASVLAYA